MMGAPQCAGNDIMAVAGGRLAMRPYRLTSVRMFATRKVAHAGSTEPINRVAFMRSSRISLRFAYAICAIAALA